MSGHEKVNVSVKKEEKLVRTLSIEEQVRQEFKSDKTLAYRFVVVSKVLFGKGVLGLPQMFFVGRDYDNDLTIEDDRCVSRRHFMIARHGAQFLVKDMGSSNGTFVNNRRIFEEAFTPLNNGDVIRCGNSHYKFILDVDMGALMVLISPDSLEEPEVDAPTRSFPAISATRRDMCAGH